jgi:hypothetical protein
MPSSRPRFVTNQVRLALPRRRTSWVVDFDTSRQFAATWKYDLIRTQAGLVTDGLDPSLLTLRVS